jgi:hypothetical protein
MMITNDYMAGLFDGEGWFQITRAKGGHYRSTREWAYQCHAAMTMREKEIVETFQSRFGGTVNLQASRSEKHSAYWKWQVTGLGAQAFAWSLEPHLILKKPQAQLINEFQAQKVLNGNKPVTDERYEFYDKCFQDMKLLNKKGVGKSVKSTLELL